MKANVGMKVGMLAIPGGDTSGGNRARDTKTRGGEIPPIPPVNSHPAKKDAYLRMFGRQDLSEV